MPRFSVAFAKRRNTAEEVGNVDLTPPGQSSFRVLERHELPGNKSFDGGARMARSSGALLPKPDFHVEDNMFADMKANRGSGLSNTTNATSTDTSSRHSNASTAPSSADFNSSNAVQDENRNASKTSSPEMPGRGPSNKSIGSKFLDRAGRTFSFGGQKKHTIPPPREDPPLPDLPPVISIKADPDRDSISRTVTASTSHTATPLKTEGPSLDLGGDFGSMFSSFDKRASMATLKNDDMASPRVLTGNRPTQTQALPQSPDTATPADPLLDPWSTPKSARHADQFDSRQSSPNYDSPPPVPPHSSSPTRFTPSTRPSEPKTDEESKLLQETYTAIKFLSTSDDFASDSQPGRYRREEESFTVIPRTKTAPSFGNIQEEDNLFEGKVSRFSRPTHRYISPQTAPPKNKVMTPAEFEKYREDKIKYGTELNSKAAKEEDDDDEINYDDDEDDAEKSKQQAKQRRKQEAHMTVYRQQMMKVTGETPDPLPLPSRPALPSSMSAPHLHGLKSPSPNLPAGVDDEDDDEEVPLAILQAHGFPNKNRPPTRLSTMGSNPNIRASALLAPGRPPSAMGDSAAARRHSTLPAFARNLPQDPFIGASIAKPAMRESLAFNDPAQIAQIPKPPSPLPPGGLVGVIANEERQRAMRRGSPSVDASRLMGSGYNGPNAPSIDPVAGIPPHMMYNQPQMHAGGVPGMAPPMMNQMPPPMLTIGDQAQLQMTQQMSQFMQMQMQFMQMMAANQGGGMPQQPQQQPQQFGGLANNHSMVDLSSRQSMLGEPIMDPRRGDYSMRTMSMVQPSSAPMINPGYAGSVRSVHGYTPSIAPSERSNIGLPNRYRPVSQAVGPSTVIQHGRSESLSGALSALADGNGKTSMRVVHKSASASDEDDEEGWEAMKNKRDKKRSLWKSKKNSVF